MSPSPVLQSHGNSSSNAVTRQLFFKCGVSQPATIGWATQTPYSFVLSPLRFFIPICPPPSPFPCPSSIRPDALQGGLDRFAQFFVAPRLSVSAESREKHAVDSEDQKNHLSDKWRIQQLLHTTSNPKHPFHKFGTGNLKTLDLDVLNGMLPGKNISLAAEVRAFQKKYYSANLMRLVVYGKEEVAQLESWARQFFSGVPTHNEEIPNWKDVPVRTTNQMGLRYNIVPVKEAREVRLVWLLPSVVPHYRKKSLEYVMGLLGGEGVGSIFALLRQRGWLESITTGTMEEGTEFVFFMVKCVLTKEGFGKIAQVVAAVYQYIEILVTHGVQEWVWQEQKALADIKWKFLEKRSPITTASDLAGSMQLYPAEDVLSWAFQYEEWDPVQVRDILTLLRPDNMLLFVIGPEVSAMKGADAPRLVEHWYRTQYSVAPLAPQLVASAHSLVDKTLAMPHTNDFVPHDFVLRASVAPTLDPITAAATGTKKPVVVPLALIDTPQMRVWFKGDDTFAVPKASVLCRADTPGMKTAKERAMGELFVDMALDSLQEALYPARLAGLSYDLRVETGGMVLEVSGYHDKLPDLVDRIVKQAWQGANGKVFENTRFLVLQQLFIRDLSNFKKKQPYQHAFSYLDYASIKPGFLPSQLLAATSALTMKEVLAFAVTVLKGPMYLECLLHGNLDKEGAMALSETVRAGLVGGSTTTPVYTQKQRVAARGRVREFAAGKDAYFKIQGPNTEDVNSAVVNKYQVGPARDDATRMAVSLLEDVLGDEAFEMLRAKEQLGYIVQFGAENLHGILAFSLIIQSATKSPDFVDGRMEAFFKAFRPVVHDLTDAKMERFKTSKQMTFAAPFRKLSDETNAYWSEIVKHRYVFNRSAVDIVAVKQVRQSDLLEIMDRFLMPGNDRRKASMQIYGKDHSAADASGKAPTNLNAAVYKEVPGIETFALSAPLYPPQVDALPSNVAMLSPSSLTPPALDHVAGVQAAALRGAAAKDGTKMAADPKAKSTPDSEAALEKDIASTLATLDTAAEQASLSVSGKSSSTTSAVASGAVSGAASGDKSSSTSSASSSATSSERSSASSVSSTQASAAASTVASHAESADISAQSSGGGSGSGGSGSSWSGAAQHAAVSGKAAGGGAGSVAAGIAAAGNAAGNAAPKVGAHASHPAMPAVAPVESIGDADLAAALKATRAPHAPVNGKHPKKAPAAQTAPPAPSAQSPGAKPHRDQPKSSGSGSSASP